jgi:lambda repressor-like predicted transcriptional regulator
MVTIDLVKRELHEQRYTLRSWALRNGFKPRTVDNSLRRALKRGKQPRGEKACAIVRGIERTINKKLFP